VLSDKGDTPAELAQLMHADRSLRKFAQQLRRDNDAANSGSLTTGFRLSESEYTISRAGAPPRTHF
jgi:hypothetical protein